MPNDTREGRADTGQVLGSWGFPVETLESRFDSPVLWLTGGISLLLWTGLALLLTSA